MLLLTKTVQSRVYRSLLFPVFLYQAESFLSHCCLNGLSILLLVITWQSVACLLESILEFLVHPWWLLSQVLHIARVVQGLQRIHCFGSHALDSFQLLLFDQEFVTTLPSGLELFLELRQVFVEVRTNLGEGICSLEGYSKDSGIFFFFLMEETSSPSSLGETGAACSLSSLLLFCCKVTCSRIRCRCRGG